MPKSWNWLEAVKAHLEEGKMARTFEVPDDEDDDRSWFKNYNLSDCKADYLCCQRSGR